MSVLPNTDVWLGSLSRGVNARSYPTAELHRLIAENQVVIPGFIRQEILAGVTSQDQLETLREAFRPFTAPEPTLEDYETAAIFYHTCRRQNLKTSMPDTLLCALSIRLGLRIFTTDKHFFLLQKHIPIHLHHA